MKRMIAVFMAFILLTFAALLTGCGGPETAKLSDGKAAAGTPEVDPTQAAEIESPQITEVDPSDIDVDITEKMYVAYINEIYVNTDDYIGETIRLQGMYQAYTDENNGNTYYYVFRTGPGCCGNDGSMCGFEFTWNGDMPKDNDWIEVTGVLRTYEDDGWTYLTLDGKSVKVMDQRGAENVYQ